MKWATPLDCGETAVTVIVEHNDWPAREVARFTWEVPGIEDATCRSRIGDVLDSIKNAKPKSAERYIDWQEYADRVEGCVDLYD